ncbi:hypothetical protein MADA3029_370002 [Vibrio nigripulchritudo MADA3029]|uniref:Uncharacterized protein n=1 Tax=Vibrio nigripulchritudo TaxID=28173 RepID=U4K8W6_9VIBR|nr:hypothetical protein [Vibrio nigripulchritudo]KJY75686.1 hypothetical protein TW74_17045 [Vibrio nigripulchritudo]CCN35142.1 hypothetical protein VIBNIAM115_1710001 [Vibrio nigripulchritudo AM115]CCN40976.1 hypothetical protein VIBNIFTn2_1420011 [Vibrio nigripulchritudo FTn2]CCN46456.1 hypothetical protein VIBNIMADA3020_1310002 [Vibrio nigripulchritudo MADA3020]CCN51511.1 hypothetical protein VIBNIMADA3021_1100002 [Vibrio nigripulchritudo MADA3021]
MENHIEINEVDEFAKMACYIFAISGSNYLDPVTGSSHSRIALDCFQNVSNAVINMEGDLPGVALADMQNLEDKFLTLNDEVDKRPYYKACLKALVDHTRYMLCNAEEGPLQLMPRDGDTLIQIYAQYDAASPTPTHAWFRWGKYLFDKMPGNLIGRCLANDTCTNPPSVDGEEDEQTVVSYDLPITMTVAQYQRLTSLRYRHTDWWV